jgi:ADP-ribose pyrophosphatase
MSDHEEAMTQPAPTIICAGRFLSLAKRDNWEYATRANAAGVIAVVPITGDHRILLVEQFRAPVGARVIEIPAGLVGDHADHTGEPHETAARRELLEETGHEADRWTMLASGPTSPGMCDEVMTLYLAQGLRRIGEPLGDGHEQITLHAVPLAELHEWLDAATARGLMVDIKLYSGVHLAARHDPEVLQSLLGPPS